MDDVNRVYGFTVSTPQTGNLNYRRQGNFVQIEGRLNTTEDINEGPTDTILNKRGYHTSGGFVVGLMYVVDTNAPEGHTHRTDTIINMGGKFIIQSDFLINKGALVTVSISFYTDDPFPDDSEIINPNPIPDKK